ncbi:L,D-transpeptidase family protein [Motilimonas pumila]|uniref:L,D-TPase catalytic domain-containing protein n=1 Tax=Motilimonas pumila TaxID=2303987 RepID=A0A418YBF7_9GAMM|nr:L,D-transpeptidase family protein [Motilimonas pumila]RJG41845.1 hypothetical protein D1Z90_15845 [Motilimonas pumila]
MFKLSNILLIIIALACVVFYYHGRAIWVPVVQKVTGKNSVVDIQARYGEAVTAKLAPAIKQAGLTLPLQQISLLAVKQDNTLALWGNNGQGWAKIKVYPVLAASGVLGPKLREGDKQVPEGVYRISGLNPNSAYHLSMKVNYPNEFDLKWAQQEGRTEPGTNIFIHGKAVSIGCLAIGDTAIEELFVLIANQGRDKVQVIISPTDPQQGPLVTPVNAPHWTPDLYQSITQAYLSVTGTGTKS